MIAYCDFLHATLVIMMEVRAESECQLAPEASEAAQLNDCQKIVKKKYLSIKPKK